MSNDKSLRQKYIDLILQRDGDEDNVQERAFLQTLGLEELRNLALVNADELADEL